MGRKLYERCPTCRGRCQTPDPADPGRDPAYVACFHCDGDGFVENGLTLEQVERWRALLLTLLDRCGQQCEIIAANAERRATR